MNDYISREALVQRLNRNLRACNPGTFSEGCYADAIETVINFPAADVEPVRHGRWERYSTTMMICSLCGKHTARHKFNFCPSCGAKMDLGGKSNEK